MNTPASHDLTAEASLSLADSLFVDEQLEEAIDAYAAALSLLSAEEAPLHKLRALSHRSAAFYGLDRHQDALEDATAALGILSQDRPSGLRQGEGELCHKRAGLAAFGLADYSTARQAFEQAAQLASLNQRSDAFYKEWIRKCDEAAGPSDAATPAEPEEEPEAPIVEEIPSKPPVLPAATAVAATHRPQMPKYQYYQSDKVMTISVLESSVQASDLDVRFEPQHLTVVLRKGGVDFTVICGTLYSEIEADRSKVVYKDEKVLIKLRKKDHHEWHELFGKAEDAKKPRLSKPAASATSAATNTEKARPYASHKNWDAIEKSVIEDEKNEKPVGDEAMNKLFQQIYAGASEETKRAMIKSYQTSGGTVLSTNWDEVSKKDYEKERTAPKGVEWKNWEGDKLPMEKDDD